MSEDKLKLLNEKRQIVNLGGGEKKIEKLHKSNKLTARERLDLLFDKNTFVEMDAFVKHRNTKFGMETQTAPAEGVVVGYGKVDGRLVYAYSQDATVIGGSLGEMHAKKITKIQDLALKVGSPIVGLNDSSGARIQEGVDALCGYGEIFYKNTLSSGVVPQICGIMGSCAGGAVFSPAVMDFTIMVDQSSQMFVTGAQVTKAETGEDIDPETLGGAFTHTSTSGVAHFMSNGDKDCILDIKKLLSFLPSNNSEKAPCLDSPDSANRLNKFLNTIISENSNDPYDMKEVINEIVDDSDFFEVHGNYACNIITGFARINGESVGIVANQPNCMDGFLDINASDKAARFIRTCDSFNISIVTLVDVPGFLSGASQEYGGIIRHGAKMLYAYSEATVPKITMILRKAYGTAYVAMASKHLGGDLVLAWPTAEIAIMNPSGAANIIFKEDISQAEDPIEMRNQRIKEYSDEFANPYKAAERGYIDDVIEPEMSRVRIADALDMLTTKREDRPAKKHGNVPM